VFYTKFADLVQQTIDDYRAERISELEYLKRVEEVLETIRRGRDDSVPEPLRGHGAAQAYYGVLGEILQQYPETETTSGDAGEAHPAYSATTRGVGMALSIEQIIEARRIRDWVQNDDVQRQMTDAIDDYLFDLRDQIGLQLETAHMDEILERCLDIARKREGG